MQKRCFKNIHCNKSDYNFALENATLITREINLLSRTCIGCALISEFSTVNLRADSYNISP